MRRKLLDRAEEDCDRARQDLEETSLKKRSAGRSEIEKITALIRREGKTRKTDIMDKYNEYAGETGRDPLMRGS
jgi:hypothetical protein